MNWIAVCSLILEMATIMNIKPRIKRVGNMWMCLGPYEVKGFGSTPCKAYLNWTRQWY